MGKTIDIIGIPTVIMSLIMNILQWGNELNMLLTIIIAFLSIIYIAMRIYNTYLDAELKKFEKQGFIKLTKEERKKK